MEKGFKGNKMRLLFIISAIVVLGVAIYSGYLMITSARMLEESTQQHLLSLSKSAATLVTSDELEQFLLPEDMEKPLYHQVRERLRIFAKDEGILFAYYMRPIGNEMLQFIIDSDDDPLEQVGLDTEPVDYEPAPVSALNGVAETAGIGNYSQNWDGILAAYAPVYNEAGEVVAIAGVDMSDEHIVASRNNMVLFMVLLIVFMLVVIVTGFFAVSLYQKKALQSESANLAKSQFLSRMSHEIRTPMNAIIGLCRMSKETENLGKIREYLDNIDISSNHLLGLIDDILDLSKIESGKIQLDEVAVDIHKEIEKVLQIITPQVVNKKQLLKTNIDTALPPFVYCDNTYLRQIVVNLLSNAVKFTPEGGEIGLCVKLLEKRGEKANIQWQVTDTGIGIHPQLLQKIFDPFEQGDGTTTRQYGGTGLGLAISKQLVEMMDGSIGVHSTQGQGSTFTFNTWLTLAKGEDVPSAREEQYKVKPDMTGKTILLVEDSQINQLIAQDVFEGLHAKVEFAGNGLIALQMFEQDPQRYDLIFMDIQMPIMDGYEATKRIRQSGIEKGKTIPIIAMTANVFKEDVEKAIAAGMDDHVGKPFQVEQVEQAIAKALNP